MKITDFFDYMTLEDEASTILNWTKYAWQIGYNERNVIIRVDAPDNSIFKITLTKQPAAPKSPLKHTAISLAYFDNPNVKNPIQISEHELLNRISYIKVECLRKAHDVILDQYRDAQQKKRDDFLDTIF